MRKSSMIPSLNPNSETFLEIEENKRRINHFLLNLHFIFAQFNQLIGYIDDGLDRNL